MFNRFFYPIFVLLLFTTLTNAQNDKITKSLKDALIHVPDSETIKVWIYFKDKGTNRSLAEAKNNLSDKSKQRRTKIMGDNLVDYYDLTLNNNYLSKITPLIKKRVVKSKWLNAISAEVYPISIEKIQNFNFVSKIDVVKKYKKHKPIEETQNDLTLKKENLYSLNYGGSFIQNNQINVPLLHDLGVDGSGVLICLLDNNYNLLNHETFSSMNIISTWDFINNDTTVNDPGEGTHGTQTLSTVGGWSPGHLIGPAFGADYILGKTEVNSFELPIEEDYWVAGAEWADSLGADVLSSSLGYIDWYTWQDMDGNTAVTTIAADIAASRGIVVVNSAGNEGTGANNTLIAPADGDSVIAVAAVTSTGNRSLFSSIGPSADGRIKPDVAAMGSSVTVASTSNPNGYTTSSGTSFSCPLTSGVAALVLSVNPSLTPMQVRDALRETASQSAAPDNYLGWGILDAYEAAFYFNSRFVHTPLNDVEDLNGPYTVISTIESRLPLIANEIKLVYGTDQNFGNEVVMQSTGNPNEYSAQIPGIGSPSQYFYYLKTINNQQITSNLPFNAPYDYFNFYAGPDTVMPEIVHSVLANQALSRWPATVNAYVTDNFGIDSVWVEFSVNSGSVQSFALSSTANSNFSGDFSISPASLSAGDSIYYRIIAVDQSSLANTTYFPSTGYQGFQVLDAMGLVLVIDDDQTIAADKPGKYYYSRPIEKLGMGASRFTNIIQNMGYIVDNVTSSLIDTSVISQYNLLISSSGGELSPVASAMLRSKLENWVLSSPDNKLIIEGGEVGYDALVSPSYPSFASNVLHANDWLSDNAGPLIINQSRLTHPIFIYPNQLPDSISINYSGWGDEDAVLPENDAYTIFNPQNNSNAGGIIIYDDDTDTTNAQIAYLAFNIEAIDDTNTANNMIENVVTYLMNTPTTDIPKVIKEKKPESFELSQNYPNPFNPETTIKFSIPNESKVIFRVFNMLGQQVYQKNLKKISAGWHKLKFSGSELSSGVYFYNITADDDSGEIFNKTQKMLLIK